MKDQQERYLVRGPNLSPADQARESGSDQSRPGMLDGESDRSIERIKKRLGGRGMFRDLRRGGSR